MTDINVLVCPLAPADVVISFDAAENFDFCVVGTLSGRAFAYKTSHIFQLLSITQPLPQFNTIHTNLPNIPQPISPYSHFDHHEQQHGTDHFGNSLNYEILSPCQTISLIGSLSSKKHHVDNLSAESVYEAAQWNQLPQFEICPQKFPLRIDCSDQHLFHQDLSYINDLQHYHLQLQQIHGNHESRTTVRPENTITLQPSHISTAIPSIPIRLTYLQPDEYICRKLVDSNANAEPIKGVHIVSNLPHNFNGPISIGSVVLALGDTMLKIAPTIKTQQLLNMRYQRTHDPKLCQSTYCLAYQSTSVLVTPGDEDTKPLLLDASTQRQSFLNPIPMDSSATPLFLYNTNLFNPTNQTEANQNQFSIAWREYSPAHHITTLLSCLLSTCKITDALYFSETKRPIGFKQSGQRIVSIVEANHIQVNNLMNILISSSLEEYYHIQELKKQPNLPKPQPTAATDREDSEDFDAELNDHQKPDHIPSEEEQQGLLIDNSTIAGSIVTKLDQRVTVRNREHSELKDRIQGFTLATSPDLYLSQEQQNSLLAFYNQNQGLFNARTKIADVLFDTVFWGQQTGQSVQPVSEDEQGLRKEIYSHAYLDWLNDQPITQHDTITYNAQNAPKQPASPLKVTKPTTPTQSSAALSPTPTASSYSTAIRHPAHFSLTSYGKSLNSSKWSAVGFQLPSDLIKPSGSHPHADAELLQHSKTFRCVKFRAHKQGHIVGMSAEFEGALVITIATDFKIKLWYKGQLICKFVNIKGDLLPTSVVLIKRVGRVIYYTCCDGVYCVILPFDPVVDIVGTNLATVFNTLSAVPITADQKLTAKLNTHGPIAQPAKIEEEHDFFDEEGVSQTNLPTASSTHTKTASGKVLHNDVVMRNYQPRFYIRSLHPCDRLCCNADDQYIPV